jgi:hypothetical protein
LDEEFEPKRVGLMDKLLVHLSIGQAINDCRCCHVLRLLVILGISFLFLIYLLASEDLLVRMRKEHAVYFGLIVRLDRKPAAIEMRVEHLF